MFKKTLLAAAVATTASFVADASTVAVTGVTHGVEYATNIQQITLPDVTFTAGRAYGDGDVITIDVTGATVATTNTASPAVAITPTVSAITGDTTPFATVQFLAYDGNQVQFLVGGQLDSGSSFDVGGITVVTTGAVDEGEVDVVGGGIVNSAVGASVVDTSTEDNAITFTTQLSSEITLAFSATVDVNEAREEFTGAATSAQSDTLTITNTLTTVATPVTTTGTSYVVAGDFSFLDENGDGDLGDSDDGSITATSGTVSVADDFQSVTVSSAGLFTPGPVSIVVSTPDDVIIPDQAFTVSQTVSYTNPAAPASSVTATLLDGEAAGSWVLNGARVNVPFMPFRSGFSQSVTISNTSSQAGSVDVVFYQGGTATTVEGVATAGARAVTDVSAALRTAFADSGLSGDTSFDLIVNAPDGSVQVVALYYVAADADRLRTK